MKFSQLGWVACAAIVGVGIGGGFRAQTHKWGFVNMQSVFEDSNLKKKNDERLRSVEQARVATLDFLGLFPAFAADQLARYRTLSVKEMPTPAETDELAKLKAAVQTATTQYDDLRKKQNPSPQELALLTDLGARNALDASTRTQWGSDFDAELRQMQTDLSSRSINAIKAAIAQSAKAQGYTLVFRENVVIYGSRDLGADVKKIADKNAK